jgi:hypothetical protein
MVAPISKGHEYRQATTHRTVSTQSLPLKTSMGLESSMDPAASVDHPAASMANRMNALKENIVTTAARDAEKSLPCETATTTLE